MTLSTPTTERRAAAPRRSGERGRAALAGLTAVLLLAVGVIAWGWWQGSLGGVPLRPHCTATALGTTTELNPEQAGNAGIIAGVALRRGLPARAATIGIATAIQESKLINLPDGDRDSIGLFQQRPSQGWGTAEQVHDPLYATNAFYDVLVKIEGYQNLPITAAAQRVQRSAFPTAYADHEPEARLWASTLAGHSPAGLDCVLADLDRDHPGGRGADGFTDAARAVRDAAREELGRSAVPTGQDGTAVRFGATDADSERMAWAVAQWAVARAAGLGVVAVEVDGRHWQRAASGRGWAPFGDAPPSGEVVVRVA